MALSWDDVETSDGFNALSSDEKNAARQQYFNEVVAPKVSKEDIPDAYAQFSSYSGLNAGGGRGSANPPSRGLIGSTVDAIKNLTTSAPMQGDAYQAEDVPTPQVQPSAGGGRGFTNPVPIGSTTPTSFKSVLDGVDMPQVQTSPGGGRGNINPPMATPDAS